MAAYFNSLNGIRLFLFFACMLFLPACSKDSAINKKDLLEQSLPQGKEELKKSLDQGEALLNDTQAKVDQAQDTYDGAKKVYDVGKEVYDAVK